MKKLLSAALAFILFAPGAFAAGGVPGNPTGAPQSAETATIVGATTTINGQCVTPASGCSTGQWARVKLGGRNSATAEVVTTNFTGTFAPYVSYNNGSTWYQIMIRSGNASGAVTGLQSGVTLSANTATQAWILVFPHKGATDIALISTAAVTNTATVTLTAANSNPQPMEGLSTSKGLQTSSGAAVSTQDNKDAGRSFVVLGADGVTPAVSDTLITFSKNVAGTVTATQTTYAITSGKTLRLQSLCASMTAGAAANIVRVRLRLNTGGACLVGSSLLLPAMELAPTYGTAAASEGWAGQCVALPDGLELSGASWNICISESAVAASGTLTVNLIGYEY